MRGLPPVVKCAMMGRFKLSDKLMIAYTWEQRVSVAVEKRGKKGWEGFSGGLTLNSFKAKVMI